jgi:anaerobic nitric oxide reductase flavorubredoxin
MAVQVAENVYWVGAVDWEARHFHGGYTYHVQRGTTYNAYLVLDERIALIDTVPPGFEEEMFYQIGQIVDPAQIDFVIANHGELDYCGTIPAVLARAPRASLICTRKGVESLSKYFPNGREYRVVETGDTISLGHKTLTFLETPTLHWPGSKLTYIPEDRLLLPNDAFGQHLASAGRFADQVDQAVLWEEARRYFANILTPFSRLVLREVEEVQQMGLAIGVIAPSYGVIWRKDPMQIVEQYVRWASGETRPRALVVYETMWGSTAEIAQAILEGIGEAGVEGRLFAVPQTDRDTVVGELLEAKGIVVGSATHNQRPLRNISALVKELVGLRPLAKIGAAFGSHGWGGGAVPVLEKGLKEAGIDVVQEGLALAWRPTAEGRAQAVDFGRAFGERIQRSVVSAVKLETGVRIERFGEKGKRT